jgi:FkbM family methyltransferase
VLSKNTPLYFCDSCKSSYKCVGKRDVYQIGDILWPFDDGIRNLTLESTESGLRRLIVDKLKNRGVFIDIGANLGVHAINLHKYFDEVVAIEPHPLNTSLMIDTLSINNIKNVSVFCLAAWNKPFVLHLSRMYKNSTDGSIFTTEERLPNTYEEFEVAGMPIDSLNLKPDCIKIDVEGAEENVLHGLENTMLYHKPVVIVEIHMLFGANKENILKYMRRIGYENEKCLHSDDNTAHYIFWFGDSFAYFVPEEYNEDMACTFGRKINYDNFSKVNILKRVDFDGKTVK